MEPLTAIILLVLINLGLLWLLMATPLGVRTVRRTIQVQAPLIDVWQAVYPLGRDANWSPAVLESQPGKEDNTIEVTYGHSDRKGEPIRRLLRLFDLNDVSDTIRSYTAEVLQDSALDASFWTDYRESWTVREVQNETHVLVERQDRYKGIAFMLFRYFALRRELSELKQFVETGSVQRTRLRFESPPVQFGLAILSTLLLWPFLGLTVQGFLMSATLTIVIALHELGHLLAYRASGHKSVRMIFIPFLGGVAIGSRPYDNLFEVAFAALMGAGFSAYLVFGAMALHPVLDAHAGTGTAMSFALFILICGAFNLLNLLPLRRFDGGQILSQIMRSNIQVFMGTALTALAIVGFGLAAGISMMVLNSALAIFVVLGVVTRAKRVKPKFQLDEMTARERILVASGFAAALFVHGTAVLYGAGAIFGST